MATAGYLQPSTRNGRERYRSPGSPTEPGGQLWPQIRIGREADYSNAYDWDLFINVLGRKNRRLGHALPLGEVACHYVTDVELRTMILDRYPDVRTDRGKARKTYRSIANETQDYLQGAQRIQSKLLREGFYDPPYGAEGKTRRMARDRWMGSVLALRPAGTAFRGYEGNKVGIDLSANRQLFEERQEILDYLRRDQGLNTNMVRHDWEPHAIIFTLHAHLSAGGVMLRYPPNEQTPSEIPFEQPHVQTDI